MILIRYFLVGLIVYLIARAFLRHGDEPPVQKQGEDKSNQPSSKKVSKKVGEYIDYEEIKEE